MEPGKFGPFLRDLRTRRGLTQEQVAEALHVSGAAVSKWENGKCLPDLTKLETLAEILHVGMLDLMQCGAAGAPPAARRAAPRRCSRNVCQTICLPSRLCAQYSIIYHQPSFICEKQPYQMFSAEIV